MKKDRKQPRRRRKERAVDEVAVRQELEKQGLRLLSYKINFERMEPDEDMPEEVDQQMAELHDLALQGAEAAIPRLEELIGRHPGVKVLWNYLQVAVGNAGDEARYRAITAEVYQRFPDYLFAWVNYGHLLLNQRRMEEFEVLFPKGIEPQIMYPDRTEFHVTEVVGVYVLAGIYHARKGDIEQARQRLELIEELDPGSPQEAMVCSELLTAITKKRARNPYLSLFSE